MNLDLIISAYNGALVKQQTDSLLIMNDTTERYGLKLSSKQAHEIVLFKQQTLKNYGRIEVRGDVINKLVYHFCDSPYISPSNYKQTICELVEIFYAYKCETYNALTDDELAELMAKYYNGCCEGSAEKLSTTALAQVADKIKRGLPIDLDEGVKNE